MPPLVHLSLSSISRCFHSVRPLVLPPARGLRNGPGHAQAFRCRSSLIDPTRHGAFRAAPSGPEPALGMEPPAPYDPAGPVRPGRDRVLRRPALSRPSQAFQLGRATHRVPMSLHATNRARLAAAMRDLGATGILLLQGGVSRMRDDTDHEPLFRQESYFAWAFGVSEPGCYGAVVIANGESTLFVPRLPPEYAVWMGPIRTPDQFRAMYGVDSAADFDPSPGASDLAARIAEIAGITDSSPGLPCLHVLEGTNTDSGASAAPAAFPGIERFPVRGDLLLPAAASLRSIKTQEEIALLRYVNAVSSAAHVEVMRRCQAGMAEYELESLFQHWTYAKGGCRHQSYTCICATGENGAVLHYGHAGAPNARVLREGDMALFDMGAEYHCYASDITCSFPVGGAFTPDQLVVYTAVLAAQKAVMAAMRPGVSWVDMHRLAERHILQGLLSGGVLRGDLESMIASHLGAVFMPHGLGHLMGLDTHDVGGYLPGHPPCPTAPGACKLRTARVLEAGMVITVEPGCYFIDPLLDAAAADPSLSLFLVTESVARLRGTGGVRLEDDVLITPGGCENLTHCPREVDDVIHVLQGGEWPRGTGDKRGD